MTKDEALKLAMEALKELVAQTESRYFCMKHDHVALQNARYAIARAREALAPIEIEKELALQKLHDENERLGLYEDAYEEKPEEEPLHPVHIGVDVTKEGTAVTAFYRKPDAVMEMFYSQFHPLAQPEQEPVGLIESLKDAKPCCGEYETCWRACTPRGKFLGQRDAQRKPLTDEEIYSITGVENRDEMMHRMARNIARAIEAAHGIKE